MPVSPVVQVAALQINLCSQIYFLYYEEEKKKKEKRLGRDVFVNADMTGMRSFFLISGIICGFVEFQLD